MPIILISPGQQKDMKIIVPDGKEKTKHHDNITF